MKYAFVLTGGIASGKSTVSNMLKNDGFNIIDLDKIAHDILSTSTKEIEKLFGKQYIKNNKIDRKALGDLIFKDKKAKQLLEDFIHPIIAQRVELEASILDSFKKPYIIDIPLFFEKKTYDIKNSILIYASKDIQIDRLQKRSNLSLKESALRVSSQMDIERKKKLASYVLPNMKGLKELSKEVEKLKKWIKDKHASIKV